MNSRSVLKPLAMDNVAKLVTYIMYSTCKVIKMHNFRHNDE